MTQRHLKRLADAGLIARFQLHRDDGGGVPLCCVASARALELVGVSARSAPELRADTLDGLCADVHVTGWLLALERLAGTALEEVLGPGRAAIAPGVAELARLEFEHGLRPRDFVFRRRNGADERFAPVRPAAVVTLRGRDLLLVADPGGARVVATLEAYDHLVSGWWRTVERYRRAGGPPSVVVLCASEDRARELAGIADQALTACLAEIGVSPREWQRPGRAGIHFAVEADMHRGLALAWRVPPLPPALRPATAEPQSPVVFAQLPPGAAQGTAKPPWL